MIDAAKTPVVVGAVPPSAASTPDSVKAAFAGWLGAALVVLGLVTFASTAALTSSLLPTSLGFGAISGIALLSVTLIGLIVLTRAVGLSDGTQALGLPNGSVRALLALILAIVFVAVASWALGGMFQPLGPLVFQGQVTDEQLRVIHSDYPPDHYVVFESEGDAKGATKVFLRRETPDKDVMDLAKQIVTISATVLVTIVGFYFGSKSASDATRSAGESLAKLHDTLKGGDADGGEAQGAPATPEQIQKTQSAIKGLATSTATKLTGLGEAPLDVLRMALADRPGDASLQSALASAETSYATMTDSAKICSDSAAQAAQLAVIPDGAGPAQLQDISKHAASLASGAMQANHAFEQALTAFVAAQKTILTATAKG